MKKLCLVTGSRAEYGILKYLIREIILDKSINFSLVVTGTHLEKKFGKTIQEIKKDKLKISKTIKLKYLNDSNADISKTTSDAISKFSNFFSKNKFDLVILLGDRYEIFGVAVAAYFSNIKIAHFHGGETTEGLIDEGIRHSITKFAHFHFVSTNMHMNRVMQLGENKKNIFNVGSLALNNISKFKYYKKKDIEKKLKYKFKKNNILMTFHPVTLENKTAMKQISIILDSLKSLNSIGVIITNPNSDSDNKIISKYIKKFAKMNYNRCIVVDSLGVDLYYSCLRHIDCVIGNSSSGIIEVPNFKIPSINIGDRQKGRTHSKSVINIDCNKKIIIKSLKNIFNGKYKNLNYTNPYYAKNSINKSIKIIKKLDLSISNKKQFMDYHK